MCQYLRYHATTYLGNKLSEKLKKTIYLVNTFHTETIKIVLWSMDELIFLHRWVGGKKDGKWTNKRMDKQINKWMDEWIDWPPLGWLYNLMESPEDVV